MNTSLFFRRIAVCFAILFTTLLSSNAFAYDPLENAQRLEEQKISYKKRAAELTARAEDASNSEREEIDRELDTIRARIDSINVDIQTYQRQALQEKNEQMQREREQALQREREQAEQLRQEQQAKADAEKRAEEEKAERERSILKKNSMGFSSDAVKPAIFFVVFIIAALMIGLSRNK